MTKILIKLLLMLTTTFLLIKLNLCCYHYPLYSCLLLGLLKMIHLEMINTHGRIFPFHVILRKIKVTCNPFLVNFEQTSVKGFLLFNCFSILFNISLRLMVTTPLMHWLYMSVLARSCHKIGCALITDIVRYNFTLFPQTFCV